MSVLYVLLPLAVLMGGLAVFAFLRAVRKGQFDDLDTPQHRMLFDDNEGGEAKTQISAEKVK
jgi:cbb3-type cytochrome oxidase maturation protein